MKASDFTKLVRSVKQAGQIKRGERRPSRVFRYEIPDVRAIRRNLHVSQVDFASMIGVSPKILESWEQGKRTPEGPARALLRVASQNPQAVLEALYP
ncbi:MAG: helix-turn-helix domain-containing protein [Planctomycetes bacterium]|nr:helix-turn-helix domain-containing protein [Planctomycetota bacterium]MBM4078818.1 helix-turn-helix domain-containing protein [Planctomycetota bacterium]